MSETEKQMTEYDYPSPYIVELTVPDSAIDVMGHVNNCEYLHWLENIAWEHSRVLGLDWAAYQRLDRGMVARHTELDYFAAGFAGDDLQICTWIVAADRISIVRQYQVLRPRDNVTLLRGHTRWVCVEISTGRPKRMPPEFVASYQVTAEPSA